MCDVCCSQFKGWCKSFTKTEVFLSILEGCLLIIFIAFLTFVVLHFLACAKEDIPLDIIPPDTHVTVTGSTSFGYTTLAPGVMCTWKPGQKTEATSQYYEQTGVMQAAAVSEGLTQKEKAPPKKIVDELLPYLSDGEVAEPNYKQYVLALVKIRPPQDITFGCILTIVDEYWAVTAASCIEAIEEVDSLDSFVMMEEYGDSAHGRTHGVADVRIHPGYQGSNRSHDLVALRSEDTLVGGAKSALELATPLDFFLATIGHKFTILGYGRYRTIDEGPGGRRLRWVRSFSLPPRQCGAAAAGGAWALRHLAHPHPAPHAACGARALCAGPLSARGAACNYCAGTPLLLRRRLAGLMSDNPHCGVACEPALFVNVALLQPWLAALFREDEDFVV